MSMTFQDAKEHLKFIILPRGYLDGEPDGAGYVFWHGGDEVRLDGSFTIDDLTAIAAYVEGFNGS